jgi:hypothetical protein
VKFVLEGTLGLYSIFGEVIVLGILGISPNLAIRADARNISSMHTSRQVSPDIWYKLPSEKLSAMGSVGFRVEEGSKFRHVIPTSGEIRARRSLRLIFNLW